jgi:hypothetical protein
LVQTDEERKAKRRARESTLEHKAKRRARESTLEHKAKRKKYSQSEKGKATDRRYKTSKKGKTVTKIYRLSEKGKSASKKYQQSEKGKSASKKYWTSEKGKTLTEKFQKGLKGKVSKRLTVLQHYSKVLSNETPYCNCCGQNSHIDFLDVDHISGRREMDSESRLKKLGYTSKLHSGVLHNWLIDNHFPEGFQILCKNCNQAKGYPRNNNECPMKGNPH